MKTLFLMRHATAGDALAEGGDHERPLAPAGVREAERVAEYLATLVPQPTLVLCSSARRTRKTLAPTEKRLPDGVQTRTLNELYLASPDELLRQIAEADDAHDALLVVAHFPGIAEVASWLTGRGDEEARSRLGRSFPPAALAVLAADVGSFAAMRGRIALLLEFTRPADLD